MGEMARFVEVGQEGEESLVQRSPHAVRARGLDHGAVRALEVWGASGGEVVEERREAPARFLERLEDVRAVVRSEADPGPRGDRHRLVEEVGDDSPQAGFVEELRV